MTSVGIAATVGAMPWMETDVRKQRVKFCLEHERGAWSMTELCAAFGISRRTGYKWLARFAEAGIDGLSDRIRAPSCHPNRIDSEIEERILGLRRRRPRWGSKKILAKLARLELGMRLPARSTVDEVLRRAGLVEPRKLRRRARATLQEQRTVAAEPNGVWAVDFKGHLRLGDRSRCDPLTITDQWSRFALLCQGLASPGFEGTKASFVEVFREYGLPRVILSDNGTPFSSTALMGLSRLNIWWLKLGIRAERITPGHPEENGKHERFHRTLKDETASPPKRTLAAQQRAFNRFRREYNEERPHEALAQRTPAELYETSPRSYPSREPSGFEYPSGFEVRRIRSNGDFKWRGLKAFVSEALAGEDVGLEAVGDGIWDVFLGPLRIAIFNEDGPRVLGLPTA